MKTEAIIDSIPSQSTIAELPDSNTTTTTTAAKSKERCYHVGFVSKLTSIAAIGGLLFGYDTGVISGASLYFEDTWSDITDGDKELVVSIAILGAGVGAFIGGPSADKFGRKPIIFIADILFTIGAIVMALAPTLAVLIVGRVIVGLGVGAASMVIPVYLAEVSPTVIRGGVVTINNLFITFGQFFSYLICLACGSNWRLMLGLAGVLSFVQFVGMFFLPESPKWLMKKGKEERAEAILKQILRQNTDIGQKEIKNEMDTIRESVNREGNLSLLQMYKQLFTTYRRSLFVGVMLLVWQQLCGINTAMYYGTYMLKQAGFGGSSRTDNLLNSLPLGAINFLGTLIAVFYTDKLGRRWMMLRCLPFLAICMVAISLGMWFAGTAGTIVSVTSLFLYIAFFAPGMGSQPWTVNSEIYPLHLRGTANSLSTTACWIANYAVSAVFLSATKTRIGKLITYNVIACFCVATFLFVYKFLPETKGRPLEEIITLFKPKGVPTNTNTTTTAEPEESQQNKDEAATSPKSSKETTDMKQNEVDIESNGAPANFKEDDTKQNPIVIADTGAEQLFIESNMNEIEIVV